MAFLITEKANPAEISPIVAFSRSACFTFEFIKTVQRVPRSQGLLDLHAASAKSIVFELSDFAKVSINEPQPEEHASFNSI